MGIACGRRVGDELQLLVVRKRYTYAFVMFVKGTYSKNECVDLFGKMTVSEKRLIQLAKFPMLWWQVFSELPNDVSRKLGIVPPPPNENDGEIVNDLLERIRNPINNSNRMICSSAQDDANVADNSFNIYKRSEAIFIQNWMSTNASFRELQTLVFNTDCVSAHWEIPKGGPKVGEASLQCATREFQQETMMSSDEGRDYVVISDVPIRNEYMDDGMLWTQQYYIARATRICTPKINMASMQSHEIDEIRWMSRDEIMRLDNPRLSPIANAAFDALVAWEQNVPREKTAALDV